MSIAEKLLKLVSIPSVTGNEQEITAFLLKQFSDLPGYRIDQVGNTFALVPLSRKHDDLIALVGHTDTVPPSAPNPARIADGRVIGTGSSDMKSGLALMWDIALSMDPDSAAYDIAYIFYDAEEGPYKNNGLGPACASWDWKNDIGLAIVLEPSNNIVQLGCLGTLHASIIAPGKSAHSARPWQGKNAIVEAMKLVDAIESTQLDPHLFNLTDELTTQSTSDKILSYKEVISVTQISAGRARNMIPDECQLNVNFRFGPNRRSADARTFILNLATSVLGNDCTCDIVDLCPSGAIPLDNALCKTFIAGTNATPQPKQAWTDVGQLSELGIDAINWGPGENAQAHQADESTSIALLEDGLNILRRFLSGE